MNSDVYRRISYADSLYKVQHDGLLLKYIQHQDLQLCTEAVKNNPRALKYIHQRSELICEEAVKSKAEAIKYIHDPSAYILKLALKKNLMSFDMFTNLMKVFG